MLRFHFLVLFREKKNYKMALLTYKIVNLFLMMLFITILRFIFINAISVVYIVIENNA